LLLPAATVGVLFGLYLFPDTVIGKGVWGLSKGWLFLIPVVWLLAVDRGRLSLSPIRKGFWESGLPMGFITGVVIFVCIVGGYLTLGKLWIDGPYMREQLIGVGIKSAGMLMLGGLYWATINASLEEYVWRWFVYRKFEDLMPTGMNTRKVAAVILSGLAFTFHHVLILMVYFDWRITLLGSIGVFVGGVTWSALYARYRSVWPGYISHAFSNVAIILVAYWIVFAEG